MRIIVRSIKSEPIREGEADKTQYCIISTGGSKYYSLDENLSNVRAGQILEVETEPRGQAWLIRSWKPATNEKRLFSPAGQTTKGPQAAEMLAARIGADLLSARVVTPGSPLGEATIRWAEKNLGVAPTEKRGE